MAIRSAQSDNVLAPDMLPVARPGDDRLPPMLFVATLFYALVILGVSFNVGMLPEPSDTTSLRRGASRRARRRPRECPDAAACSGC